MWSGPMATGLLQLLLWYHHGGGSKSSGRSLTIEEKDGLFYIGLSYMMHRKRQHPCICVLLHFELVG